VGHGVFAAGCHDAFAESSQALRNWEGHGDPATISMGRNLSIEKRIGYFTCLFQDHSWWARFLESNILASLSLGPAKSSLRACQNVFLTIFVGQLIPLIVRETEGG
jgi:hypothetical protein